MKRWAAVAAAALLGVVAGLFLVSGIAAGPHEFAGTVLSDPEAAPHFTLTADNGQPMGIGDFRGKVVLLYFGYTFCPDICPASLAELADAVEVLGDDGDQVQVVMVSVDPARDTPEVLGSYVDHFNPSFVGMTGTDVEIAEVAARYNVFYAAQEGSTATGYLVDHWSGVMVIDPDGMLVELLSFGTSGQQIAADVREWLS